MFEPFLFLLNLPQTSFILFPEQTSAAKQSAYTGFVSPERFPVSLLWHQFANRENQ